jgi:hypothetical protein
MAWQAGHPRLPLDADNEDMHGGTKPRHGSLIAQQA